MSSGMAVIFILFAAQQASKSRYTYIEDERGLFRIVYRYASE